MARVVESYVRLPEGNITSGSTIIGRRTDDKDCWEVLSRAINTLWARKFGPLMVDGHFAEEDFLGQSAPIYSTRRYRYRFRTPYYLSDPGMTYNIVVQLRGRRSTAYAGASTSWQIGIEINAGGATAYEVNGGSVSTDFVWKPASFSVNDSNPYTEIIFDVRVMGGSVAANTNYISDVSVFVFCGTESLTSIASGDLSPISERVPALDVDFTYQQFPAGPHLFRAMRKILEMVYEYRTGQLYSWQHSAHAGVTSLMQEQSATLTPKFWGPLTRLPGASTLHVHFFLGRVYKTGSWNSTIGSSSGGEILVEVGSQQQSLTNSIVGWITMQFDDVLPSDGLTISIAESDIWNLSVWWDKAELP